MKEFITMTNDRNFLKKLAYFDGDRYLLKALADEVTGASEEKIDNYLNGLPKEVIMDIKVNSRMPHPYKKETNLYDEEKVKQLRSDYLKDPQAHNPVFKSLSDYDIQKYLELFQKASRRTATEEESAEMDRLLDKLNNRFDFLKANKPIAGLSDKEDDEFKKLEYLLGGRMSKVETSRPSESSWSSSQVKQVQNLLNQLQKKSPFLPKTTDFQSGEQIYEDEYSVKEDSYLGPQIIAALKSYNEYLKRKGLPTVNVSSFKEVSQSLSKSVSQ
jgi:hypothetical protein